MRSLFPLLIAVFGTTVFAAPFPGTGSSALVSSKPGLFLSGKGFRLDAADTAWIQTPGPKQIASLVTVYKSPIAHAGQQPALTVRVDELHRPENLRAYVHHWMRDYTRFGFEVLTAKSVHVKGNSAFLLDILSHETHKQLRQVLFLRDKTAVILTCRDQQSSFAKTVKDCNQIIETFAWE